MKATDFTHPSNQHPLRAWLLKEQIMVIVVNLNWNINNACAIAECRRDDGSYLSVPRAPGMRADPFGWWVNTDNPQTVLLHPTGVWGKKVCSTCEGRCFHGTDVIRDLNGVETRTSIPCSTCNGTGYIKAMIYQGDVLWFPSIRATGIIFWQSNRRGFAIQFQGHIQGVNVYLGADVTHDIILGSIFEFDKMQRPEGVSDEQWSWLENEARELRENLNTQGETS